MDLSAFRLSCQLTRRFFVSSFITVLLLTLISPPIAAEAANENSLEVWVFSLYPPAVMNNKLKPYMDYLKRQTGFSLHVQSSSLSSKIIHNCETGKPHIIFASGVIGAQVVEKCHYRTIAITHQPLLLYVKKNSSINNLEEVQRIGGIKNSDMATALYEELRLFDDEIIIVYYSNLMTLMKGQIRDNLNAIILGKAIMKASPMLDNQYRSILTFKGHGKGMITVSPLVSDAVRTKLANLLLTNGRLAEKTWQQGIGAGPFLPPNNSP
ncbi:MAG: hypothetical protein JKY89_04440 [Immundisolibacteraceae bacterium]|nr:hypothetical protein [Immundisolibacteraceae bacterium]